MKSRIRPIDELTSLLGRAGFEDARDERAGDGEGAFHLLVADRPSEA